MDKSALTIAHEHGAKMHILGLKHAIEILKIADRDEALIILSKKIERLEKELEDGA